MGLSSKRVSSDELDWSQDLLKSAGLEISNPPAQKRQQQPQQQRHPQLNCPRCDSTNTKFCYYNNYSKLQPRHFCKVCRRHWTNGGTLRNVPVGGGRKNKRPKTSHHQPTPPTTITSNNSNTNNSNLLQQHQQQQLPLSFGNILRQALLQPASQLPPQSESDYSINSGSISSSSYLLGSLLSLPPVPQFTSTAAAVISPYESNTTTNPFSTDSLSFFNLTGQDPAEEDVSTISGSITPWQQQLLDPASSNTDGSMKVLESSSSSFWSYWDDLVSPDLQHPPSQDSPHP